MRKIAAVIFDLWDTLIQERPGGNEKVARLRIERIADILTKRGAVHSPEEIRLAYNRTGEFLELAWSKRRDMPVRDQVLFMLNCVDGKLSRRIGREGFGEVQKVYEESLLDNPPLLLPGAKEALGAVRSRGYKMGLISNTGRTPGRVLRVVMDRMDISECFNAMTFSDEILVRKPAEKAFRTTLDRLKILPKAAVHVGDDADKDVLGARKAGMRTIQVLANGEERSEVADFVVGSLAEVPDRLDAL